MPERERMMQDVFLSELVKTAAPTTVFLVNGVKLQGAIVGFDTFSILLRREGHSQLVYKHAISTILPVLPVKLDESTPKSAN